MTAAASAAERLRAIETRIQQACGRVRRSPAEVTLVGASKQQPIGVLRETAAAGLTVFGENRVQEARDKIPQLGGEIDWHLIGPLQSNKARLAVTLFSTVQSIDRIKIARTLDREAARGGRTITGFLEVNVGGEASKHGFSPAGLAEQVAPLAELESLRIVGLMAIPPFEEATESSRRWFRRLREVRDELFARPEWSTRPGLLSMGMSHDFEVAIEEGATHVRVGTALFGPRPTA